MKREKPALLAISARKILILCLVAVIVTTFMSMRMVTNNVQTELENNKDENGNGNGNRNGNGNDILLDERNNGQNDGDFDDSGPLSKLDQIRKELKIKKKGSSEAPNFFNKYELPFRSHPKIMSEQEQYEANRLKALRSKANDEERPILLKWVMDEVEREKGMIAAMPVHDRPDCVAVPPASALVDYVKLDANEHKVLLLDSSWKLDSTRNRFLLPKPHIFVHVPKTGGSSLGNIFKRNERRDQFSHFWAHPGKHELEHMATKLTTVFGHVRYGLHFYYDLYKPGQLAPRDDGLNPYSYMTMLREPVDRVVSHYYYHRQNKRDPGHQLAIRNTFKEWLSKSPAANNEQARMLCGVAPYDYVGLENQTESCAVHHLQYTYKFVGITEKFSESLVLLSHYGGFQAIRFTKINSGTQRVSVNEVEDEIIKEIIQRNQADIYLYEQAKIIFEKQIDAIGRDFVEAETKEFKKKIKLF